MKNTRADSQYEKDSAEQGRSKLVPDLRFGEFDSKWKASKFGSVNEILDSLHQTPKEYIEEGFAMIRVTDVNGGNLNINKCLKVSKEVFNEFTKKHTPTKGDIIMSRVGTCGAAIKLTSNEPVCLGQNTVLLIPNIEKSFVFNFMKSRFFQNQVDSMIVGSTQKTLSLRDLKKFEINLPSLPEQEKIASFLSAVDEKIQQLTKKKELLEQYKKGVMQQLFPSGDGQASGALRFRDENGVEYPEWEEKRFSDLYSFHSTNSLSRAKLNYEDGSVYNIHYGDIHTIFKTEFRINEAHIPFVNDDVDLSKMKSESYCKNGDLVMADASEDYADIGKTIELIDLQDKKVLAGLHTFLARPITSETAVGFFSNLLKSWYMRRQIMTIAQGSKVLGLANGRVSKLKLKLPVIEEQQKIATFLSNIDIKIESVNKQITYTQNFKKGLLQQMFV